MTFGERGRALSTAEGLTLRALGERVGVFCSDVIEVESRKPDLGDPSCVDLIRRLARVLGGGEEAILLAAETIRRRVFERPNASHRIARLDGESLDRLLTAIPGDGAAGGVERVDVRRA